MGHWDEPTAALRTALRCLQWTVRRNASCLRSQRWPLLDPEPTYPGQVLLQPEDSFPPALAVFTDGSVSQRGGAAACQPDTDAQVIASVVNPRSSTQCELTALVLAVSLQPTHILTDSLTSLHLVRGWGAFPTARALGCADRVEVRQFLHAASAAGISPTLEKVKAHDERAIELGHPKAAGNDRADQLAGQASATGAPWRPDAVAFGDPVELVDDAGHQEDGVLQLVEQAGAQTPS